MITTTESEKKSGDFVWQEIKNKLRGGFVVGLKGDLGSGKTAIVKQISSKIKIKEKVTSPTFNLRKIYPLSVKISGANFVQHIDLYRIEKPSQEMILEVLEWVEQPDIISFIEWPESIPQVEKRADLIVKIKPLSKNSREIELLWK